MRMIWKSGLAVASGVALLSFATIPGSAMPASTTVTFSSQSGSGETGTATLTPVGSKTKVVISMMGAPDTAQPAHIHTGTCSKLNPTPAYPLNSVTNGKSTSTVPVSLAKLMAGTYAINVHKSTAQLTTYVACGNIKNTTGGAMMMHGASVTGQVSPMPDASSVASPEPEPSLGSAGPAEPPVGPIPTPGMTAGPETPASHSP